jgi:hypothetical protein
MIPTAAQLGVTRGMGVTLAEQGSPQGSPLSSPFTSAPYTEGVTLVTLFAAPTRVTGAHACALTGARATRPESPRGSPGSRSDTSTCY